jgi:hypothetical protein
MTRESWTMIPKMSKEIRYAAQISSPIPGGAHAAEALKKVPPEARLGKLHWAFHSTPMNPELSLPGFGLLFLLGVGMMVLFPALMLDAWFDPKRRDNVAKMLVHPAFWVMMALAEGFALLVVIFAARMFSWIAADAGQLLFVFEGGLVRLKAGHAEVYPWEMATVVKHRAVREFWGNHPAGTVHVYTIRHRDGHHLHLTGRSYQSDQPADPRVIETLAFPRIDVWVVGELAIRRTALPGHLPEPGPQ